MESHCYALSLRVSRPGRQASWMSYRCSFFAAPLKCVLRFSSPTFLLSAYSLSAATTTTITSSTFTATDDAQVSGFHGGSIIVKGFVPLHSLTAERERGIWVVDQQMLEINSAITNTPRTHSSLLNCDSRTVATMYCTLINCGGFRVLQFLCD